MENAYLGDCGKERDLDEAAQETDIDISSAIHSQSENRILKKRLDALIFETSSKVLAKLSQAKITNVVRDENKRLHGELGNALASCQIGITRLSSLRLDVQSVMNKSLR